MTLEITPAQLKERLDQKEELQLVDVREQMEWDYCNLGGTHIPLGELPRRIAEVRTDVPVVLVCHHGMRSGQALRFLQQATGADNFLNLRGGIHAWSMQVDPKVPVY